MFSHLAKLVEICLKFKYLKGLDTSNCVQDFMKLIY